MKKYTPIIFACLIVFLIVGALFFFSRTTSTQTHFSQEKINQFNQELSQTSPDSRLFTYTSNTLGYSLSYDPSVWIESATDFSQTDLTTAYLKLRSTYGGLGLVGYNLIPTATFEVELAKAERAGQPLPGNDKLEQLANFVQAYTEKNLASSTLARQNNEKVESNERVTIGNQEMYKLTIVSTPKIGGEIRKYSYIVLGPGEYYAVIHADYADIADTKELVEAQIGQFEFMSNVKGVSTSSATPDDTLSKAQITDLVKPSVTNVLHLYCKSVKVSNQGLTHLKSTYSFCSGGKGSGWVVDPKGYFATNGHVVSTYPEEALVTNYANSQLTPFFTDLIRETFLLQTGQDISDAQALAIYKEIATNPSQLMSFLGLIYELMNNSVLAVEDDVSVTYVKLDDTAYELDGTKLNAMSLRNVVKPGENIFEVTVVGSDYANRFSKEVVIDKQPAVGSDVALLKVSQPSSLIFPALPFGNSAQLKDGTELLVLGYPGLVEGEDSLIDYSSSAGKVTVTQGIVSSIKTDTNGNLLIQTDASIDHGNSGGPAINLNGEVIGIATYGKTSGSGNYNLLRDVADIQALLDQQNVAHSPEDNSTYNTWQAGLTNFWQGFYRKSLKDFEQIIEEYPPMQSIVSDYVSDAQQAIEEGKDRSPAISFNLESSSPLVAIIIFVVILGIAAVFIRKLSQGGGKTQPTITPSTPVEPVASVAPPAMPAATPEMPVAPAPEVSAPVAAPMPDATQPPAIVQPMPEPVTYQSAPPAVITQPAEPTQPVPPTQQMPPTQPVTQAPNSPTPAAGIG